MNKWTENREFVIDSLYKEMMARMPKHAVTLAEVRITTREKGIFTQISTFVHTVKQLKGNKA